ncbi:MAG: radical SAM protein [Pseudomonadales bacterium]|nr:radical SAM protein [Pseudomonadales bacterium]
MKFTHESIIVDVEISSRCNATCNYCPREDLLLGHMTSSTYQRVLERLDEMRVPPEIHICGKGDPSVHPDLVFFVEEASARGYKVFVTSNGRLITRDVAQKLVDAGLTGIYFSVATLPDEYDDFYGLPFQAVRQNIIDFNAVAGEKCRCIVSISHRAENENGPCKSQKKYWKALGIKEFLVIHYHNRAAIYSDMERDYYDMAYPEIRKLIHRHGLMGLCFSPFKVININWDGGYQICANDFTMKSVLGNIFDMSIRDAQIKRLDYFSQENIVCKRCNVYHRTFDSLMKDESTENVERYIDFENLLSDLAQG